MNTTQGAKPDWNPYLAGVALGLVLLTSFLVFGYGLGSSSAVTRAAYAAAHAVAPGAVEGNAYMGGYFATESSIFSDWMVFLVVGVFLGGLVAAYSGRRTKLGGVSKGPNISRGKRIALAVAGGVVMGIAARLARGCTSGQALTGGAVLSLGSWIFMVAVFAGGYLTAPFVRRQWK